MGTELEGRRAELLEEIEMTLQDIVDDGSPRAQYIKAVANKLSEIDDGSAKFYFMTAKAIEDSFIAELKSAIELLKGWEKSELEKSKDVFAKIAAMSIMGMDIADYKLFKMGKGI